MNIKELVQKYQKNRDAYLDEKYNETLLRSDFLDPFFELLGWDIKNVGSKSFNEREVILEESLKTSINEYSKKPDYTFRLFSERKFFLEAKKPCIKIESDNNSAKQIRKYGFSARLKISVVSNFEFLLIYDTSVVVEKDDPCHKALIKSFHFEEYENKFEEILVLLGQNSVYSGQFDVIWKDIDEKIDHYSIDDLFLSQINQWRFLLGSELYQYNHEFKDDQLNDIVQSYLNRIIFLRVCEDRNIEVYQTLLNYANTSDFTLLVNKFKEADKKYNSGLFDQLLSDKVIENISSIFWLIIKQLYYPESVYSFSVLSSDILGQIYEIFLSEKLAIIDNNIVLVCKPENLDRDIVTTPTFIINDILRLTLKEKYSDFSNINLLSSKFADISCGSGAFLLELFQVLNDMFIDFYLKTDRTVLIRTGLHSYKLPFELKKEILLKCIYGIDKDFNAAEATKFGLLLKLLENEDLSSLNTSSPILPDLKNNIYYGNSLIEPSQIKSKNDHNAINPFSFKDMKFDIIVGNPPYMKSEDMVNITPKEFLYYKTYYKSAYKQFDKYFLFIEQGLRLLKDDGRLGYIVPSKFLKVGAASKLRGIISSNKYLQTLVSFGANQIFKDKSTYTCLLVLANTKTERFKFTEVQDLKSWKVRDYRTITFSEKNMTMLNEEAWILVPRELESAYNKILENSVRLVDIVGSDNIFNGIQTSANPTYVFQPVKETGSHYYFLKNNMEYKIEKKITKPYFQTTHGEDNLFTYRTFKPNARVFYPYIKSSTGLNLISLEEIKTEFPMAFNYLKSNKKLLDNPKRDIQPKPTTKNEWHRYGRHQSLDNCGLPEKIIVGVLSIGNKYAIDTHGTLISSGGTAGYCVIAMPSESRYSIYYIQAILNSKYIEWVCALSGEVFRGGYIARGTKVLKNLPIRKIDFSIKEDKKAHDNIAALQKMLISAYDEIDINRGDKRKLILCERRFNELKEKMDNYIRILYNLSDKDDQVPLIRDLYAVN